MTGILLSPGERRIKYPHPDSPPMPFEYHLWSHRLVSDFDLGELEPASTSCSNPVIRICRSSEADLPLPESPPLFEDRTDEGDLLFVSWKLDEGYYASFPGLCSFRIWPDAMRIDCAPAHGLSESGIAHLIIDGGIPRMLSVKPGYLVLHASAIQIDDRVFAIIGRSGQGKSTLASWFASQGFPLLTDDCLIVRWDQPSRKWLAQPSYQSVRLWPDSVEALGIAPAQLREFAGYSSKRRTGREVAFRLASNGSPLSACFVMPMADEPFGPHPVHSGPPQIQPLAVNQAFLALAGAAFRLNVADPEVNRREFEVLATLTASVHFWSLAYEREYRWLPAIQAAIINTVQAAGTPPHDSRKIPHS